MCSISAEHTSFICSLWKKVANIDFYDFEISFFRLRSPILSIKDVKYLKICFISFLLKLWKWKYLYKKRFELEIRVKHSHWSRSLEILLSDWWNTYNTGTKVYAITTHLKLKAHKDSILRRPQHLHLEPLVLQSVRNVNIISPMFLLPSAARHPCLSNFWTGDPSFPPVIVFLSGIRSNLSPNYTLTGWHLGTFLPF